MICLHAKFLTIFLYNSLDMSFVIEEGVVYQCNDTEISICHPDILDSKLVQVHMLTFVAVIGQSFNIKLLVDSL